MNTRTMIKKEYKKDKQWKLIEETTENITDEFFNNMIGKDTLAFFRRLGGSETWKGNTLTSINPNRTIKIERTFKHL